MIGKLGLAVGIAVNVAVLAVVDDDTYGFELKANLWRPGKQILHGHSPYDPAYPKRALADGLDCCMQALYPAPTHVLFAPLSWLPFQVAMLLFTAITTVALVAGLWLLGMRSAAAFGLTLMFPPVWSGIAAGGIMPFLVLGCALCWRWRDRPILGGVAVAATAVLKVFLWPLCLWLLFTRRFRAAAVSVVAAVALLAAGWAVIGFQNLFDYPGLLRNAAELEQDGGLGLVRIGGQWLALAAFAGLMLLARRSFPLVIIAALALTPIVWLQTYEILLVPIVLAFAQRDAYRDVRLPKRLRISSDATGIRPVRPAER
jgi:Glycosyltransferase family 87